MWWFDRSGDKAGLEQILTQASGPLVIKPNAMGASHFATVLESPDAETALRACKKILPYDNRVLIQEYVHGTEYTCGCVERSGALHVLPVIEAITGEKFLSHEVKHKKGFIEAKLYEKDTEITRQLKAATESVFRLCGFFGMSRLDFIVTDAREIYFLEANSIPGLMPGSAFPKMLAAEGFDRLDLVGWLMEAEKSREGREKKLVYEIET